MVRYLIKYSKESDIKFLSHLDLMRTIQRVIRRAKLPIEYSKGFNPHMSISIAQPLSVGVYSTGEYLDTVFTEEVEEKEILKALNENTVAGIKFLSATKVARKEGQKNQQAMATIDAAKYVIKLKLKNADEVDMDSVMDLSQWTILKKSKSGEKETDIKPLIKDIKYSMKDDILTIETLLSCGSRENLSPSLLSEFIKTHVNGIKEDAFVDIKRVEMYAFKGKELLSLQEFFAKY
ncbi:TIGR03936 family radical SAM-associated protein [Clostridium sp. UBA1056]|uniref:TIGR03936 family radical SAM-associated protein n=1 Tax=unclassified Clostridium TaxID=2614128 RepID=UPI003217AC53